MIQVVLVEDDPALRFLVKSELESTGKFQVVGQAANGAEGIKQVKHCKSGLHIVLLDLNMPVMDGLTALPRILKAAPDAAVVVLSMRPRAEAEPEALRLGATAFIDKNIDGDTLSTRLLAIVAQAAAQRRPAKGVRPKMVRKVPPVTPRATDAPGGASVPPS